VVLQTGEGVAALSVEDCGCFTIRDTPRRIYPQYCGSCRGTLKQRYDHTVDRTQIYGEMFLAVMLSLWADIAL
jgi:hypothetical protein